MDGRGALRWSGLLLLAAAGCQHTVTTVPNPGSLSSAEKAPALDRAQIKPASAKAKDPPPLVWVSLADFKAGEASAAAVTVDRRQHIRDEARADYQKALKLDPKCVPAYQGLARLYSTLHDTPLAIETYRQALKIAPNNAALWYELGMCHHSHKDFGPALECLDRAAKLDPGNRSYVNGMGVVLAEAGRYDESLNCFSRSGGEALGCYRLAQTLRRLQQPELSQRYLAVALEKDPSLASMLASPNSAAPAVEQTAYQAPDSQAADVSPAPAAPAPPRVISVQTSHNYQSPQQVLLPPPPAVNEQYEQPQ